MKKKIAVICDQLEVYGGRERVVCFHCNDLVEFYDVYCVNLWRNTPAYPISDKVHMVYLHEERQRLRYALSGSVSALRRLIKEEGIELVFCDGASAVIETFFATRGLAVKIIYREHTGMKVFRAKAKGSVKSLVYTRLVQAIIEKATDKIIVLTEKEADNYVKDFHVAREKVQVIPHYMDERLLEATRTYADSSKQIITVGRMDIAKGYEYLIEVARKVLGKHPDWEWHIFGDGDAAYTAEIAGKIQAAGLAGKLILKGADHEVYKRYRDYALQVVTSRNETFSMVLLEGKANRLPEVAFDIEAGPSDLILDGVNGYLVAPFDVEAMAERIDFLIEHPEVRRAFSARAYDNIDGFRKEAVMKQWVDLINNVLKLGGGTFLLSIRPAPGRWEARYADIGDRAYLQGGEVSRLLCG